MCTFSWTRDYNFKIAFSTETLAIVIQETHHKVDILLVKEGDPDEEHEETD